MYVCMSLTLEGCFHQLKGGERTCVQGMCAQSLLSHIATIVLKPITVQYATNRSVM